jgi:peptidoglycan/xylan/chitin deacetylase (PgdA/CDA1 family)
MKIALLNTKNEDFYGYKKILDQEKFPYEIVDKFVNSNDNSFYQITPDSSGRKAVQSFLHYKEHKVPGGFLRILVNKFFSKPVKQISLRKHREHLRNKIEQITKIKHKDYWPQNHNACFNLRIDVDFPIRYFYKKKQILNALIDFKKDLNKFGIKATFFLNLEHLKEAKMVKEVFKDHDLQLHGCSKKIPHRRYGYDLNNISYQEIYEMLSWGKKLTGATIFAPPCEHVNKNVLDACEKLDFKAISSGHLGKDDLPYRCYLGWEYNLYNVPTSSVELLENVPLSHYLKELEEVVKSNSLFSIYFHPILLLNHKNKILNLLKEVVKARNEKKVWVATQLEVVDWWDKRDK